MVSGTMINQSLQLHHQSQMMSLRLSLFGNHSILLQRNLMQVTSNLMMSCLHDFMQSSLVQPQLVTYLKRWMMNRLQHQLLILNQQSHLLPHKRKRMTLWIISQNSQTDNGFAGVAQQAEQLICNQQVESSSPSTSTILYVLKGQ